jgi:hypothetical protein
MTRAQAHPDGKTITHRDDLDWDHRFALAVLYEDDLDSHLDSDAATDLDSHVNSIDPLTDAGAQLAPP